MTPEGRQKLREVARAVKLRDTGSSSPLTRGPTSDRWILQTSNSFRRIGTRFGDGDVLCATKHPHDGWPDLLGASGVLDYIVAAQPHVVTALLDDLDAAEDKLQESHAIVEKITEIEMRLDKVRAALDVAVVKLSTADAIADVRGALAIIQGALVDQTTPMTPPPPPETEQ
jgi:hypothetical protein